SAIAAQFPEVLMLPNEELARLNLAGNQSENQPSESASGVPSTVVKWANSTWQVLRSGAVKLEI
ncbi:MAG TPA: hypothetical protein V6D04_03885, partial [Candidatus Obscuribacterales bacterium]